MAAFSRGRAHRVDRAGKASLSENIEAVHYPRDLGLLHPGREQASPSVQKITNKTFREDGMSKHVVGRNTGLPEKRGIFGCSVCRHGRASLGGAGVRQDRLFAGADRSIGAERQAGIARRQDLEEEINAKGGLLGRKVELINYDDQSNPANIPGIYTNCSTSTKSILSTGPMAPISLHRRFRWSCKRASC